MLDETSLIIKGHFNPLRGIVRDVSFIISVWIVQRDLSLVVSCLHYRDTYIMDIIDCMMGGTYLPRDTSYKVPINPDEMIEKHYQTTRTQSVEKVKKYSNKVAIYNMHNIT
jgi:hypothetical protein